MAYASIQYLHNVGRSIGAKIQELSGCLVSRGEGLCKEVSSQE